jgi:hypothetical protein
VQTGERVSIGIGHGAAGSRLAAISPRSDAESTGPGPATILRRSAQPTRRAVLQLQDPGDPAAPPGLPEWFAERAFHCYTVGARLPSAARLSTRHGRRAWRPAFADLDAAFAGLRRTDGIASVIVTARGRAAVAAAMWTDAGPEPRADALILSSPAWPKGSLHLNISCPVLVIADRASSVARTSPWPRRAPGPGAPPTLGSHVTWVALPHAGPGQEQILDELGRWLGAYMYSQARDQLL